MSLSFLAPAIVSTPITQIWLLRSWQLWQHGVPVELPAGQPRLLLIYLLLQPDGVALRTTLLDELWPDVPPDRARRYLTDALYRLRRALDPAPILADTERIALDPSHAWWVDLWAFSAMAASQERTTLLAALDLVTTVLAPEVDAHWILVHRLHLQERYAQLTLTVAAHAEPTDRATELLYRRLLRFDPLLEAAHCGLMRTLAKQGQLAAALQQYDTLVDLLERELAAPPSLATRLLADQLYQELDLARQRAETPPLRRLVGRSAERTTLLTALDRARAGQAGLVVLMGEPGIGKTTLLRDLAAAADWRGWQIHWGQGYDGLAPAPYAPLTAALNLALPAPRVAQLAATLPPIWFNLLARLLPPLARTDFASPPMLPSPAYEAAQLPQALAQLLLALQEVAPLLLLLDDVQWSDPALWPLLGSLMPLVRQQRLLVVLGGRQTDLQQQSTVWAQLEAWDREGMAQIVQLRSLTLAEVSELAAGHATSASVPLTLQQQADLHSASGGNPLFALELLAAGNSQELLATRPAIRTVITQRLQQLAAPTRQALGLAAILGAQVVYAEWEQLWQRENPYTEGVAPHATALERAGLLLIAQDGYAFAHDLLHAVVLAALDPATQQRCHATVLNYLAPQHESHLGKVDLLRLLFHAQGAQDAQAVVRYAQAAGEQALAAFAFTSAERHFTLVLEQLWQRPELPDRADREYAARMGRIEALHWLARREKEAADLAVMDLTTLTVAQQAAVLNRQAEYQLAVGDLATSQTTITQGLALVDELALTQAAALYWQAGRIARSCKASEAAQRYISAAQVRYAQVGDSWGVAATHDLLGGLAWDEGDYPRAAALHMAAADAFQSMGDLVREAQSLNNLGSAYWELGRYADARATHERSIIVCRELGNKLGEGDNIDNLGGVAWVLGDYTLAIRRYRAALTLREQIDDLWGVAISLSNLGSAYRLQGSLQQALAYYERSLPLCQQVGLKRHEAYVLHGLGQTLLALGRVAEAWSWLQQALTMRVEIGDRLRLIETHVALLHAALAGGDEAGAIQHAAATEALLEATDRAASRQEVYFARFLLAEYQQQPAQATHWLALAWTAQAELAAPLSPADRTLFLQNVPLNRALAAAVARYTVTQTIAVARASAAPSITWTLVHPTDSLIAEPTQRRRHVLARLIAEASAQAMTPTHDQLADALGVSRRTILRDLPHLPS
ncbi:MAG: AAA family ATPase [Caldilineaceae bacterium]|nr:AAA family ATPase [Caldilineaceae bacterium]